MSIETSSILIVDDDVDTCANLADILSDMGYQVETAHDGESALELVQQKRYDVALLDLKMPDIDGVTLYREIKKVRSGTVALIVTAYATTETANEARQAGAWQVLSKPIDFNKLLPMIDQAVHQPLVMIVDDDHDLCENLWDVLRERGLRVCIAHDEQEAEERLKSGGFKTVLIDMKLPKGDGNRVFELVRRISPDARTVLVTGYRSETEQMVQKVLSEGADAVCYKPFEMHELLETIDRLVRSAG